MSEELFPEIKALSDMIEVERLSTKTVSLKVLSESLKSALLSVQADIEDIRELIHPDNDPDYDDIVEAFNKLDWLINYINGVVASHKNSLRILSKF
jgi:hypothetical protein